MVGPLLTPDEPAPVSVFNDRGASPFVIICDHAGRALPRALGDLGLDEEQRCAHIAWDIGAAEVARHLAVELDAVLFLQHYSRLVVDCNRPLTASDSIPEVTGGVHVPGNQRLTPSQIAARVDGVFTPYHDRIRTTLDARQHPYALVSMHSFTPVFCGVARQLHAGVLFLNDSRLAAPFLGLLRAERGLEVGDNEPYRASVDTDYSIIEHAEHRGAPYVEIEVRQDLISSPSGQMEWAQRLARCLRSASAMSPW